MGWQPNYQSEGQIYAGLHARRTQPERARSACSTRTTITARTIVKGFKDGLGDKAKSMIVAEAALRDDRSDRRFAGRQPARRRAPTCSSTSRSRNSPRRRSRKAAEIGWKPLHILNSVSTLGRRRAEAGRIRERRRTSSSTFYLKDPTDPTWKDDAGYKEWVAFMDKYYPEGDKTDGFNVYGLYGRRRRLVQVLKQCGDDLTRENIMKQAASLKDLDAADAAARASRSTPARPTSPRSSRCRWPASTASAGSCSARSGKPRSTSDPAPSVPLRSPPPPLRGEEP